MARLYVTCDKLVTEIHQIWSTNFKVHNLTSISCWQLNKRFVLETIELLQTNVRQKSYACAKQQCRYMGYKKAGIFNTRVHPYTFA
jgi:hypothetical protein